jgi:hypothetical protein
MVSKDISNPSAVMAGLVPAIHAVAAGADAGGSVYIMTNRPRPRARGAPPIGSQPMSEAMRVACRCGAVEIEISGEPVAQFYCHCDDCQIVHGGAYVPESVYAADAVRVVRGEPAAWTLKRNPRVFCRDCGTRLFIEVLALGFRGVNGALLAPGRFEPQFHMQCQFAVRPVADSLPHFKSRPARFGGSDETVDW